MGSEIMGETGITNDPASEPHSEHFSATGTDMQLVWDLTAKTVNVPTGVNAIETSLPFGLFLPGMNFVLLPHGFKVAGGSAQAALGPSGSFDVSGFVKFVESYAPMVLGMLKTMITTFESKKKT